ncbi:hypothetical protein OKJ48_24155 [Streptomyces kunmingensis]|uniref:Uncharacterized protein n=1 Tax=Streptomyces kunmingensis TaxID=68225 RepID=A0ABU6CF53_9ACTN|nr:hypothetical protein [Streptomyces kunmingensis]MEB3963311.1 hypothetical protein [Streptomyces kunmingensis]
MSAASQIHHPSSGDLALVALGSETYETTAQHVRGCETCRSALEAFLRILEAGRAGPMGAVAPPADVWEAIRRRM